jgi:HEAT repeat protein
MKRPLTALFVAAALSVPATCQPASPSGEPAGGRAPEEPFFEPPPPHVARRVSALIERLRGPTSLRERSEILDLLVDQGSAAIPLLIAEMERRSDETQAEMVYALGAIGDPAVIPVLEKRVPRQSGRPQLELYYSLALAGDESALSRALRSTHATMLFGEGGNVIDYIAGALGPRAVPVLIREIPNRASSSRIAGLGALGTIADASAAEFLIEWAERPEMLDRRYAIIALARIGDPRALPVLVEALGDEEPAVREAAAEGLGYIHRREAVAPLAARLSKLQPGPEWDAVIWSLGLTGGPDAARVLVEAYRRLPPGERNLVLQALGNSRDAAALDPLTESALTGGPTAGELAVEGLRKLDDRPAATERLLRVCTESRSSGASLLAAVELAARAEPRATPCIMQALRKDLERQRGLSQEALQILESLPESANLGAAEAISSLVEDVTAPALAYRLRTTASGIRRVVELGSEVEPWLELMESGSSDEVDLAIRRLGALGDPRAVEPLTRAFGRIEPERGHLVVEALGRIGSERGTPFLVSLLTSDVYRLDVLARARAGAALALARYAKSAHAGDALESAFLAERGRLFSPIMALARIEGREGIPRLLELKTVLMRRRDKLSLERHEKVNWAIRMLRAGEEIPLSAVTE